MERKTKEGIQGWSGEVRADSGERKEISQVLSGKKAKCLAMAKRGKRVQEQASEMRGWEAVRGRAGDRGKVQDTKG